MRIKSRPVFRKSGPTQKHLRAAGHAFFSYPTALMHWEKERPDEQQAGAALPELAELEFKAGVIHVAGPLYVLHKREKDPGADP